MVAADLENIAKLEPNEGVNDPNFCYYLSLKCSHCSSVIPKEVCLSLSEHKKFKKAEIHLKKECKQCGQEGIIVMIPEKGLCSFNGV